MKLGKGSFRRDEKGDRIGYGGENDGGRVREGSKMRELVCAEGSKKGEVAGAEGNKMRDWFVQRGVR
jgi:hypothetical protein